MTVSRSGGIASAHRRDERALKRKSTWGRTVANAEPIVAAPRELRRLERRPIQYERGLNDDAKLIEATLAGDTAAYGKLVLEYQDRLYNSLLRVVGCADDARDLVQDAAGATYAVAWSCQRNDSRIRRAALRSFRTPSRPDRTLRHSSGRRRRPLRRYPCAPG